MTSLNYVTLTGDLGTAAAAATAAFTASGWLTDSADELLIPPEPVTITLPAAGTFATSLLATDNLAPLPAGWTWKASFQLPGISAETFSFLLPAGPLAFTATHATPCVFTAAGSAYVNGTGVQLSGGSLPGGFSAAVTYYVAAASGNTFELAATSGGAALASTGTGSGSALTVSTDISAVVTVEPAAAMAAYMPLPSGTPVSGDVPVATGSGQASEWTAGGSGGGTVDSVTAADASVVVTGTVANPAVATGTLDVVAAQHPPAANWSNNSHKITNLANGSGAQDAAAFGQIPAALPPNGSAGGVLTGTYPNPGITTLNQNTTGTASNITDTLDQVPHAAASVNLNSQKITGLANGSGAQDAAAFGQVPVIDSTTGDIAAAPATAAAGSTGKAADAGHVHPQPPVFAPSGLTGATSASRYAGATASGAPASGTFAVGDYVIDRSGTIWICTTAGSPGTWTQISGSGGISPPAGDIGGTAGSPTVVATHLSSPLPLTQGGTGLSEATAAALLAALGALPVAGGTMTGWQAPAAVSLSFASTVTVNAALGNVFNLTLTASTATMGAPSNPVEGQAIRFRLTQGTGGSFTVAWNAAYDFGAMGAPGLSVTAGVVDVLGFEYVASVSKWCFLGAALGN